MAKKQQNSPVSLVHVDKKTTIGDGRISTSSINKHKRRSFKKYIGQGR